MGMSGESFASGLKETLVLMEGVVDSQHPSESRSAEDLRFFGRAVLWDSAWSNSPGSCRFVMAVRGIRDVGEVLLCAPIL